MQAKLTAHHLLGIADPEYQPGRVQAPQIGLIAQGAEIFAELGEIVAVFGFFELDYFRLSR